MKIASVRSFAIFLYLLKKVLLFNNELKVSMSENNRYMAYIWVKASNGLVGETKFMKNLNLSSVKRGDKLKNFYNEEVSIFNVFDNDLTLTPEGVKPLNLISKQEKVHKLISEMVSSMRNADIPDLHLNIVSENISNYGKIIKSLSNVGILTESIDGNFFDLDKYLDSRNELICESSSLDSLNMFTIKSLVSTFDSFLYSEGMLKDESFVVRAKLSDDNSEESYVYSINYSDILHDLNNFSDYCHSLKNILLNDGVPSIKIKL